MKHNNNLNVTLRHYINENKNNKKRKNRLIKESQLFSSKTIICVDIQPEYEDYIQFGLKEWGEFVNESSKNNSIIFLYNGFDTLGMIEENDYKSWLVQDCGIDEDVIYNSDFYDKGYAFFRYCMDNSIDEENISDLVKYMYNNGINDSRYINSDMWDDYMDKSNHSSEDLRELLEISDDIIRIPDLMDFVKYYNSIILLGGGVTECLKEVEIALNALDKDYEIYDNFTY